MLVLTRKVGERILVGDDIVVTVLDSRGEGVRIGIDAPRGIRIQREEVVKAVTEANQAAAKPAADAEARLRAALGGLPTGAAAPARTGDPAATGPTATAPRADAAPSPTPDQSPAEDPRR